MRLGREWYDASQWVESNPVYYHFLRTSNKVQMCRSITILCEQCLRRKHQFDDWAAVEGLEFRTASAENFLFKKDSSKCEGSPKTIPLPRWWNQVSGFLGRLEGRVTMYPWVEVENSGWSCSKSEFELIPEFRVITFQFQLINKSTTDESEYYGPFNALLNDLFRVLSGCSSFQAHCWLFPSRLHCHIPYHKAKIPILFIKVKPLLVYDLDSSRKAVDDQIRKRVSQLYGGKYPHPQALRNALSHSTAYRPSTRLYCRHCA